MLTRFSWRKFYLVSITSIFLLNSYFASAAESGGGGGTTGTKTTSSGSSIGSNGPAGGPAPSSSSGSSGSGSSSGSKGPAGGPAPSSSSGSSGSGSSSGSKGPAGGPAPSSSSGSSGSGSSSGSSGPAGGPVPSSPSGSGGLASSVTPPSQSVLSAVIGRASAAASAVANNLGMTASAVNKIINTTFDIMKIHYDAKQAGLMAQRNSITGTLGISTAGAQLAMDRAFFRGVRTSYTNSGFDFTKQNVVPTGPMAAVVGGVTDPDMRKTAANLDDLFVSGKANIIMPGTMSEEQLRGYYGPALYDGLSDVQKFGLTHSIVAVANVANLGTVSPIAGAGTDGFTTSDTRFSGSHLVVVSGDKSHDLATTIRHETVHAGEAAIFDAVNSLYPKMSAADFAKALDCAVRTSAFQNDWMSDTLTTSPITPKTFGDPNVYFDRFIEFDAFSQESVNGQFWKDEVLKNNSNLSAKDVDDLYDMYKNSAVLTGYQDDIRNMLDIVEVYEK